LEDIKKFDHLSMFSKDIKASWKGKEIEGLQGNKEQRRSQQDIWFRNKGNVAEEDDDDFEKFFSLKICDEQDDVIPNIFHIWHKASSDKQLRDNNHNENRLMKSQSFDSEIIKRKDSHTPLPAFRNYCLQQEANKEEQPKPQTSLFNTSSKPKDTVNSPSKFVFRSLIPNHDAKLWYYRDLQGNVQGPFSGQLMDDWYSRGYLPLDLDITIARSTGCRKLKELVEITKKNEGLGNNNGSYTHVAQPNPSIPTTSQYSGQAPNKVLQGAWSSNQDNMNRDHGNVFNKGNGILSGQFSSQSMTTQKPTQPTNIFFNMKPIQQERTPLKVPSNEHQKNSQNDSVYNMVDNTKRPFQNVVTENCCPNLGSFNIFASNLTTNNSVSSNANKSVKTNPQQLNQAQIHLSYPMFNSQFDNFKGTNSNQANPSGYRPQQMMNFNQAQGFDGSKVEANSNHLRNLPR